MSTSNHDIFISYSRRDANIVYQVVNKIEEAGFTVWIDKDGIESGDAFKGVIVKAIESCKIVLFFSSKASNSTAWTTKEIAVAIYEGKRVIPIRLDRAKYNSEIKFDLVNLDFIDMINPDQFKEETRRLIKSLENLKRKDETCSSTDRTDAFQNDINNPERQSEPKSKKFTQAASSHIPKYQPQNTPEQAVTPPHQKYGHNNHNIFENKGCLISFLACLGGLIILIIILGIIGSDENNSNNTSSDTEDSITVIESPTNTVEEPEYSAEYMSQLGYEAYNKQQYADAVKWFRLAADQGEVYAQYNLALCYEQGKGVPVNYDAAVKWYRKAAQQEHADAQYNLGACYENGEGVPMNYDEAVKWYRKAARQKQELAISRLKYLNELDQ